MVWASRSDSKSVLLMLGPSVGLLFVLPPLAMGGLRDCSDDLRRAAIAACYFAGVADELARAVFPRIVERKGAAGIARQRQRAHASDRQILMQDADRVIGDDVLRPGDGKSGDRNPAGERLELHYTEGIGEAWKHEHVRARQMRSENAVVQHAEKLCIGELALELGFLRAGADDDLGAGQIEGEERFQVFLDGDPTDRHEDRA